MANHFALPAVPLAFQCKPESCKRGITKDYKHKKMYLKKRIYVMK